MSLIVEEDESPKESLFNYISARSPEASTPKFSAIIGCCRTCEHAHIIRRQYESAPDVYCQAFGQKNRQMPLDIVECSSYLQRGRVMLRDHLELAILIDTRDEAGQYL